MLGQKDGLVRVTAQMPRKENSVGHLAGSRKEVNVSHRWQAQPSIGGYTSRGLTWSQNHDSAASMFPLVPGWEEDYQDLSVYCQKPEHNMSSGKEIGTKIFSCIAPDDELNTPEICVQEFDYPAHENVSRDDTSPTSLFDGGMWDAPVDTTQTSLNKEGGGVTPIMFVEPSNEIIQMPVNDPKEVEVLNNELWIPVPAMDHEEEIDSSNENIMLQDSVSQDMIIDVNQTNNIIEVEVLVDKTNSESLTETADSQMESNVEANLKYLESLLYMTNPLSAQDGNDVTDQIKLETNTYMEVESQLNFEQPVRASADEQIIETAAVAVQRVEKPPKVKNQLSLNLAEILATDDQISTPVILESILGEEVSIDNLLNFVQADSQELKTANDALASTVDFTAVSSSTNLHREVIVQPESSGFTKPDHEVVIKPEPGGATDTNSVIRPVVIKKSPNGQLSVSQKQESSVKSEIVNQGRGFGRKKIVIKKTTKKIPVSETGSVLKANVVNKQTSKQKTFEKEVSVPKPRGRPPREPTPSTSTEHVTRPKRQRKVTETSDYDYDISSPTSSKRSRHSSVESESGKYRELRDRNNEASRKSRLNRKVREHEMQEMAERLERENQSLRIKAEEMDRLVKKLRQSLLEAVTKGKKKDDQ